MAKRKHAEIEKRHEKTSSHDRTSMDCFEVFCWNQVSFQEVELSTLTLECLNLSGCHTFQLDLCLLPPPAPLHWIPSVPGIRALGETVNSYGLHQFGLGVGFNGSSCINVNLYIRIQNVCLHPNMFQNFRKYPHKL